MFGNTIYNWSIKSEVGGNLRAALGATKKRESTFKTIHLHKITSEKTIGFMHWTQSSTYREKTSSNPDWRGLRVTTYYCILQQYKAFQSSWYTMALTNISTAASLSSETLNYNTRASTRKKRLILPPRLSLQIKPDIKGTSLLSLSTSRRCMPFSLSPLLSYIIKTNELFIFRKYSTIFHLWPLHRNGGQLNVSNPGGKDQDLGDKRWGEPVTWYIALFFLVFLQLVLGDTGFPQGEVKRGKEKHPK